MNLLLPMLIFSTVLPAFDSKNMASVLSVVITSFFYQGVHASTLGFLGIREIGENILEAKYIGFGLCFGLTVRWLTPIPASWRGGVLAAGSYSHQLYFIPSRFTINYANRGLQQCGRSCKSFLFLLVSEHSTKSGRFMIPLRRTFISHLDGDDPIGREAPIGLGYMPYRAVYICLLGLLGRLTSGG